jgi:hypothetical protein
MYRFVCAASPFIVLLAFFVHAAEQQQGWPPPRAYICVRLTLKVRDKSVPNWRSPLQPNSLPL